MQDQLARAKKVTQTSGLVEKELERYQQLMPVIINSLKRITDRTDCVECKDPEACNHLLSYVGWRDWWKKAKKDFEVSEPGK